VLSGGQVKPLSSPMSITWVFPMSQTTMLFPQLMHAHEVVQNSSKTWYALFKFSHIPCRNNEVSFANSKSWRI
jgi:hypothetical protein